MSAAALLAQPRYEVFPAGSVEQAVADWVPPGMTVTVTASPARGLDATLDLTERLAARGYRVVPHLSARLVTGDAHLDAIVARLLACGVDDVFVPAGDADPPARRFDSALSLLTRLTEMGRPFARVGITGYPESHPRIDDDITVQAMWDKRHHSSYIVSNLLLRPGRAAQVGDPDPGARRHAAALRRTGGTGGPGEAAAHGGAGGCRRIHPLPGRTYGLVFAPRPARRLQPGAPPGPDRGGPDRSRRAVAGLHLFTFNQVRQTEEWRAALLDGWPAGTAGDWPSDRTGRDSSLVTHRRPQCVPPCLQNAAHSGLRRHRLSCATVSIDCNGSREMSGCRWEQTVNSHDNCNEVARIRMAITPARLVEWPLRCGPVPPLADCHSTRPETGTGPDRQARSRRHVNSRPGSRRRSGRGSFGRGQRCSYSHLGRRFLPGLPRLRRLATSRGSADLAASGGPATCRLRRNGEDPAGARR